MSNVKLQHLYTVKNEKILRVVYWNIIFWRARAYPRKKSGESIELLAYIMGRLNQARINAGLPTSFDIGGPII